MRKLVVIFALVPGFAFAQPAPAQQNHQLDILVSQATTIIIQMKAQIEQDQLIIGNYQEQLKGLHDDNVKLQAQLKNTPDKPAESPPASH